MADKDKKKKPAETKPAETKPAGGKAFDLNALMSGSPGAANDPYAELLRSLMAKDTLSENEKRVFDALIARAGAKADAAKGDLASGEASKIQAQGTKARLDAEAENLIPAKAAQISNSSFIGGSPVSLYGMRMFLARNMTSERRRQIAGRMGMPAPYLAELDRQELDKASRVRYAKKGMYGFSGFDENGVRQYGANNIYDTTKKDFNDAVARLADAAQNRRDAAKSRIFAKAFAEESDKILFRYLEGGPLVEVTQAQKQKAQKHYAQVKDENGNVINNYVEDPRTGRYVENKEATKKLEEIYAKQEAAEREAAEKQKVLLKGADEATSPARPTTDGSTDTTKKQEAPKKQEVLAKRADETVSTIRPTTDESADAVLTDMDAATRDGYVPSEVPIPASTKPKKPASEYHRPTFDNKTIIDEDIGVQADVLGGAMMSPRGWLDTYLAGGFV